jgi:hypothetical protein
MLAAERRVAGPSVPVSHEPIVAAPAATVQREICALSGMNANAWCPIRRKEWVAQEGPSLPCSWHHLSDGHLLTFWPPEYRQWAHDHGLQDGLSSKVQPVSADARGARSDVSSRAHRESTPLTIVSPPEDATYLIDPTLRREFQTLKLRAVAATPGPIEWSVAGSVVGTAESDQAIEWPLAPGRHRIVARDRKGTAVEATITVR